MHTSHDALWRPPRGPRPFLHPCPVETPGGPTRLRPSLSLSSFHSSPCPSLSVPFPSASISTSSPLCPTPVLTRIIPRIIERVAVRRGRKREGGGRRGWMEKEVRIPTAFASCSFGVSIRILVCGFYFKHRAHRRDKPARQFDADDENHENAASGDSFFESKILPWCSCCHITRTCRFVSISLWRNWKVTLARF